MWTGVRSAPKTHSHIMIDMIGVINVIEDFMMECFRSVFNGKSENETTDRSLDKY